MGESFRREIATNDFEMACGNILQFPAEVMELNQLIDVTAFAAAFFAVEEERNFGTIEKTQEMGIGALKPAMPRSQSAENAFLG